MPTPSADTSASSVRERILVVAGRHMLEYGYSSFTMDDLARELGMSKKTLYVHFAGKDEIVETAIDRFAADVRAMADALFADTALAYPEKLHRLFQEMLLRVARIKAHVLRDLQRNAPHLFRRVEEFRGYTLPYVFNQLLREGQVAGMVRADIDTDFAITFWLAAVQNLMHPDYLDRHGLTPAETLGRAIRLFFGGLLTPAAHKQYEKLLPR